MLVEIKRGVKGFTLLELLIVLALIGIASGFAVASVDKLAMKMEERRWEDRTRQALLALRNEAIHRGLTVAAVIAFDTAEIRQINGTESVLLLKLPSNFRYEWTSATGNTEVDVGQKTALYFFADGAMDGQAFDLISPQGRRYEFKLTKHTGQVHGRLSHALP